MLPASHDPGGVNPELCLFDLPVDRRLDPGLVASPAVLAIAWLATSGANGNMLVAESLTSGRSDGRLTVPIALVPWQP